MRTEDAWTIFVIAQCFSVSYRVCIHRYTLTLKMSTEQAQIIPSLSPHRMTQMDLLKSQVCEKGK